VRVDLKSIEIRFKDLNSCSLNNPMGYMPRFKPGGGGSLVLP